MKTWTSYIYQLLFAFLDLVHFEECHIFQLHSLCSPTWKDRSSAQLLPIGTKITCKLGQLEIDVLLVLN